MQLCCYHERNVATVSAVAVSAAAVVVSEDNATVASDAWLDSNVIDSAAIKIATYCKFYTCWNCISTKVRISSVSVTAERSTKLSS